MAAPLEPQRLAELVDLAERPREAGWSLRAALCRYAQPEPQRSAAVLSVMRRVDRALNEHLRVLRRDGAALLERAGALRDRPVQPGPVDEFDRLVGVLEVATELDRLGDAIADWAIDRQGERPDTPIDLVLGRIVPHLEVLGIDEEAPPPRGARSRG